MFKRQCGEQSEFTLTEDSIPDSDVQCEIIGKEYGFCDYPKMYIASFCPIKGWNAHDRYNSRFHEVYAWKPLNKKVSDLIKKHTKKPDKD